MAKPGFYQINSVRGDPLSLEITFKDADGNLEDFSSPTAYVWEAQVRPTPDSDVFENFTVDTSDQANGVLTLTLTKTQTEGISENSVWDLAGAPTGTDKTTYLAGPFINKKDVTRV